MTFRTQPSLVITAICIAGFLAGCNEEEELQVEETVEQSFEVAPNARISIRNEDGAIRIYGARTTTAKVQAIKKAYGRDRLEKLKIDISQQPAAVNIETSYPPRPKFSWSDRSGIVEYTIVVPDTCTVSRLELTNGEVLLEGMRGAAVSAKVVNGRMLDHNGFGKHELFVANGGLDVAFDWWERGKFSVEAKIVNGNMHAFIPSDSSFHLHATALSGRIANDFGEKEERPDARVRNVDMAVGPNPDPSIELQATEGNISVVEANP